VPAVCADKAVRRYLALCTAKVKSRWVRCLLSSTEMCGTGTGAVHMQPVRRGEHQGGQPARVGERVRVCALRRLPRHPQAHRCARSRWRCSDSASQRSSACARRKRRRDARPCMKRCEQWCLCANRPGPCSWAGCIGGPRWWYELRVVLSWPVARRQPEAVPRAGWAGVPAAQDQHAAHPAGLPAAAAARQPAPSRGLGRRGALDCRTGFLVAAANVPTTGSCTDYQVTCNSANHIGHAHVREPSACACACERCSASVAAPVPGLY